MKNKLVLLSLLMMALSAHAVTTTASLNVTANLNSSCTIETRPMNFGSITPAATGIVTGRGNVISRCSNGVLYKLSYSAGSSNNIADRKMNGGTGNNDKLSYNLYSTSSFAVLLGDDVTGSKMSRTGTGTDLSETIFGRLYLNQYVKADTYSDELVVTLEY